MVQLVVMAVALEKLCKERNALDKKIAACEKKLVAEAKACAKSAPGKKPAGKKAAVKKAAKKPAAKKPAAKKPAAPKPELKL